MEEATTEYSTYVDISPRWIHVDQLDIDIEELTIPIIRTRRRRNRRLHAIANSVPSVIQSAPLSVDMSDFSPPVIIDQENETVQSTNDNRAQSRRSFRDRWKSARVFNHQGRYFLTCPLEMAKDTDKACLDIVRELSRHELARIAHMTHTPIEASNDEFRICDRLVQRFPHFKKVINKETLRRQSKSVVRGIGTFVLPAVGMAAAAAVAARRKGWAEEDIKIQNEENLNEGKRQEAYAKALEEAGQEELSDEQQRKFNQAWDEMRKTGAAKLKWEGEKAAVIVTLLASLSLGMIASFFFGKDRDSDSRKIKVQQRERSDRIAKRLLK